MSDTHQEPDIAEDKPAMEEDIRLSRFLGAVLLIVIPIFGFYYGSVFLKTGAVDGKIWYYDYRPDDVFAGLKGALVGLAIALVMNFVIWVVYKRQTNEDLVHEWYEPQSHKSSHH